MTRREFLYVPLAAASLRAAASHVELRSRQIHLDFENSSEVTDIGADFDEKEFARSLRDARVTTVNIVAKDRFGFAYYETAIGRRHPGLKWDLFGAMARSCKSAGIGVTYSYWLGVDGCAHLDQVVRENREIVSKYPVDGAFLDDVRCAEAEGLSAVVRGSVFYNNRPTDVVRSEINAFTHLEIDTGFQWRVQYLRTLRKDYVGIARNPADFEYDCLNFIAHGAKACTALPMTPRGRVNLDAVGPVYRKLEGLEPWTQGCRAVADIGLFGTAPSSVLTELHQQWNVIDEESDFALYKLIIFATELAADARLSPLALVKLGTYKQRGGAVIANLSAKDPLVDLISKLMPRPSVIAPNLPPEARVTMLEQRTQGNLRRIVHILHKGVLENIQLSVSLPQHPLGVVLIPSERPLEFKHNEFYTTFTVPRIEGHQAIAFE